MLFRSNGSVRYLGEIVGMASHAGTTPMDRRRDAATAAAELALYVEKRGGAVPHLVATVGMLEVPNGSINVVPGRCKFSLDIRATTNEVRDACAADVRAPNCSASASGAACISSSRKRCAPPRRLRRPTGSNAGSARCRRSACRCFACPAAPATTR